MENSIRRFPRLNKYMRREKDIILAARILSMLFTPFYLPFIGLVALFLFSYLSIFPWQYKLQVLTMAYLFTILMPTVMIHLYRRYQGWNLIELGHRERRMVPYVAGLLVQIVCALINVWWKISTHTAAIGGVAGALFAFAEYLGFNPVWWLCLVFIIAGMVGTSRMILRQHTLGQVVGGFWVGFLCAAVAILFL